MPMIKLNTSVEIPQELIGELSAIIAEIIGKPEKYVMVVVAPADLMMSGTAEAAIYAEVKSIGGLGAVVNHEITLKVCDMLNDRLGISAERIYITFADVAADHWGWNGSTFG